MPKKLADSGLFGNPNHKERLPALFTKFRLMLLVEDYLCTLRQRQSRNILISYMTPGPALKDP